MLSVIEREETRPGGAVIVLRAEGRLDSEGVDPFKAAVQNILLRDQFRIVVDMAEVRYLNSAALRVLAEGVTRCRANGGDLRIAEPAAKVRQIFEISGFDRFLSIFDGVEAALASFE
ncbi:MAG: STAS domain-containing protein [Anaerolineae bacterium]|nr:STAS domain-containing protein [Anaerolineae bacterium]